MARLLPEAFTDTMSRGLNGLICMDREGGGDEVVVAGGEKNRRRVKGVESRCFKKRNSNPVTNELLPIFHQWSYTDF